MKKEKVAILGASNNPARYAHIALKMLQSYGHEPIPVSPKLSEVEGIKAYPKLTDIKEKVDTLTMYVGSAISQNLTEDILALRPARVIFNPGSENEKLAEKLNAAGIKTEEACTLVLLRTNQFS